MINQCFKIWNLKSSRFVYEQKPATGPVQDTQAPSTQEVPPPKNTPDALKPEVPPPIDHVALTDTKKTETLDKGHAAYKTAVNSLNQMGQIENKTKTA